VYRNGTAVLNGLAITSWSGYSKLAEYQTISNWNNFTVVEFKFLWLGGAVLIVSIKNSKGFVEAHRFDYAGTASDVFILSPNQPLRYEIRSSTGSGSFRYICSQVATEGSVDESGEGLGLYNASAIATNNVGTIYALMGIRKSATYRDIAVQIVDMEVVNTTVTTDSGILMVIINPTLSGALTYGTLGRFEVGYATNQTITAGTGRVLGVTGASQSGGGSNVFSKSYLSFLSGTIANVFDEYVLAYMPITANQSVHGMLNIKKY
jgi:hypothetical protein